MQYHVSAPGKDLLYHECAEKNAILLLQQDSLEGMQKKMGCFLQPIFFGMIAVL